MMMRKTFLIPLLALLSTAPAPAQTTARTFSYDAAGNRIAMGVPMSQAPRRPSAVLGAGEETSVSITSRPDGHVEILPRQSAGRDVTYSATVYNAAGQVVAVLPATDSPRSTIDLSPLQPGVYVVDVLVGDRHATRKVTKE